MPLNELRGHRALYAALLSELRDRPSHGYLFHGPGGIGKALVAQGLAHGLLCERRPGADFCCTPGRCPVRARPSAPARGAQTAAQPRCECCSACVQAAFGIHPDLSLVARLPNRTEVLIEQVRDLIAKLGIKPARGSVRIAIIDDAHTLGLPAQNALLKTLEEPPGHAIIFVVAQSDRALLDTVRSRLRPVRFAPLSVADVAAILTALAGLEPARAAALARLSRGSVARALRMVEGEEPPLRELILALREARTADFSTAEQLAQEFFSGREQAGENFELLARLLEEILCLKLLGTAAEPPSPELGALMSELGDTLTTDVIVLGIGLAVRAAQAVAAMANPRVQAERWWLTVGQALRSEL